MNNPNLTQVLSGMRHVSLLPSLPVNDSKARKKFSDTTIRSCEGTKGDRLCLCTYSTYHDLPPAVKTKVCMIPTLYAVHLFEIWFYVAYILTTKQDNEGHTNSTENRDG